MASNKLVAKSIEKDFCMDDFIKLENSLETLISHNHVSHQYPITIWF